MKLKNNNLIVLLKKGEKSAFTQLIDLYHHKLCIYANSLINNSLQAEDIVQNVYINVWEKRHLLREEYSLQSYLYKAVYNEFIDQYRKTQSVLRIEKTYIEYLNTIVFNEKEQVDTDKLIKIVQKQIENLPPKCKQVFTLSKREGLTNIEISEHLNISVKAVEAQITRGFKIVRKNITNTIKPILFLTFKRA